MTCAFKCSLIRSKTVTNLLFWGALLPATCWAQRQVYVSDNPGQRPLKPNFDALSVSPARPAAASAARFARPGTKVHFNERLGVPNFVWTAQTPPRNTAPSGRQKPEEAAARTYLGAHAELYGLKSADIRGAVLQSIHNTGRGSIIVKFRQLVGGIEIFREEVKVAMTQKLELVAISGHLASAQAVNSAQRTFSLTPQQAIARAIGDLLDTTVDALQLQRTGSQGPYGIYQFASEAAARGAGVRMIEPARAKAVYFRLPDRLEAAYYVEFQVARLRDGDDAAYGYVIGATTGNLLFRHNQIAQDSFNYRVWALPNLPKPPLDNPHGNGATPKNPPVPDDSIPPFINQNMVSLQSGLISTGDPWLPPGATTTVGNNVEAYADLASPDGYDPTTVDTYGKTTSANTFDHIYNPNLPPGNNPSQIQASIVQLFFTVNFFHDWYYDFGFKEEDGNAQANNYGRGGLGGDSIRAESQDFGGRNNANMFTPADGARPRMQMYIFDGRITVSLTATGGVTGTFQVGIAFFGPTNFNVTAPVSLTTPADGCAAITTPLAGKIAFIDRGACGFAIKVKNAQLAGAVGAIIANVASSGNPTIPPGMLGDDPTITIPSLSLNLADGNLFRAALGNGAAVTANMKRTTEVERDSALDNQIVAHEWGHFISNRLVGDAAGLNTNMAGGLGEGWGDFHGLLMTVKPEDSFYPSNRLYQGVYPLATYAFSDYYFGIRRVPYSVNFNVNPLTFKHISDDVPLPDGVPMIPIPAPNSEVHNTGEIWATMLWECWASLLRDTLGTNPRLTFNEARDRMKDYIVAGYKMTPINPTLLEARDALLAAAYANDKIDYYRFWAAFARRGAGINAIAPDRYSPTNSPVVESFEVGGALEIISMTLDDTSLTCDNDKVLDNSEVGALVITIRNTGTRPLSATKATVTSTNPNISFPNGNQAAIPSTQPFETKPVFFTVALNGAAGIETFDLKVSVTDPALTPSAPVVKTLVTRGNFDTVLGSTTDDVESPVSTWTPTLTFGIGLFERTIETTSPLNHVWHGPTLGLRSDRALVSPVLNVGAGPFSFSFDHRYSFEADATTVYDGGVIEISADGGATWQDIGAGYTGTISNCCSNPLAGRMAYARTSAGYPAKVNQTINLGTTYANQTVRIRFRIGEDEAFGFPGWDLDNFVFNGITNAPFTSIVVDPGCVVRQPTSQISQSLGR